METVNPTYAWCSLLIEELFRQGVRFFVLSPGSRSAPLAMCAAGHPGITCVVHPDERGAAFYALGYVAGGGGPAALVCTSGTAAANYLPAVIESSKKKLPLLVLSADRPPELRQTGAPQTIDQVGLYREYVRWQCDLPTPATDIPPAFLLTTVDQAVHRAVSGMPGPVHLNVMLREPLDPAPDGRDVEAWLAPLASWRSGTAPYTRYSVGTIQRRFDDDAELAGILRSGRGLIAAGKLARESDRRAVLELAEALQWPLLADISSGLRLRRHPCVIPHPDLLLAAGPPAPEVVLHFGGRITAKRFYQFMDAARPRHYVMALGHPLRSDPLHRVSLRLQAPPGEAAAALRAMAPTHSDGAFLDSWRRPAERIRAMLDDYRRTCVELNEITTAADLVELLPDGAGLFLSNSMPVRDIDTFAPHTGRALEIGANRGASGIDGIAASACGFCRARQTPTALLIGDLALYHDLNSLLLTRTLNAPLLIVVSNNDGGGIFHFLPIADHESERARFERCCVAPHGMDFRAVAAQFGLPWHKAEGRADFANLVKQALQGTQAVMIEVAGERHSNRREHRILLEAARRAAGEDIPPISSEVNP